MTTLCRRFWPAAVVALALVAAVVANIRPYGYRITAIFHMDPVIAEGNRLPQGFVVLQAPSYDGAQYYQVSRNIPKLMDSRKWREIPAKPPASYAYQRFLLPASAYVVALGNVRALPYTFLLLNLAALIGAAVLLLKKGVKPLYALALCLSPAAAVAMHFTLAEPLTILLISFVLLRMKDGARVGWPDIVALSLLVFAREVNILFVAFLLGYSLLKKRPRDMALLLIPVACFLAWHGFLYHLFGNIPFFTSTGARELPGRAAIRILFGLHGYDKKTLSSIALMLGFVFPGIAYTLSVLWKQRRIDLLPLGSIAFFGVMLIMPFYIWGSVTSIGRVITPIYPLYVLLLASRDSRLTKVLAAALLGLGIVTAAGLALSIHPFTLAA